MTKFVAGNNVRDSGEAEQIVVHNLDEREGKRRFYGLQVPSDGSPDPRDGKKASEVNEDWLLANPRPMKVDKEPGERIYVSNGAERVRIYHPSQIDQNRESSGYYPVKP